MAKRRSTEPIPAFPADIDRDAFGHWLSGFVDGEGCFSLCMMKSRTSVNGWTPSGRFGIALRDDDLPVLELVRSFFACGSINREDRDERHPNANPAARFQVSSAPLLATVILPHFERYPLRAKKLRDFTIWKQGVLLLHHVASTRPRNINSSRGTLPKWSSSEREEFARLAHLLRQQREYQAPTLTAPPATREGQPTLFEL